MLRPRIIPCLLIDKNRLIKTLNFKDPKYVGDPLNAVKIFNEKTVDELILLDISASRDGDAPNVELISKIAAECRMPLCYGGGIKSVEQAKDILSLGVEKVSLSSAAIDNSSLLENIAAEVGSQSLVVTLDVKKKRFGSGYNVYTLNGTKKHRASLFDLLSLFEQSGVGEIVINSIDNDGTMMGFDFELINQVKKAVNIPLTALGGAGKLDDFHRLHRENGIIGMSAGSFFVFKGKFRAVLISYPSPEEKKIIFTKQTLVVG